MDDARKTLISLRHDALQRGMIDLAEVYGWSAIRLGEEALIRKSLLLRYEAAKRQFERPQGPL